MTELLKELLTDEQVEMLKQNNVSEYYRLNFGDEDEYEDDNLEEEPKKPKKVGNKKKRNAGKQQK